MGRTSLMRSAVRVAALCLLARCPEIHVTGIEVASRYAMLCEENAKRNGFGGSIRVIHADIKEALRKDLASMPSHGSFSHAFANPPYFEDGKATPSPHLLKAQAHAFGPDDLELWVKVMHTMVALRGTVTIVHRAETLGKLLATMEDRFGDIRIAPLYAREGTAASRVIVQGVKGSKAPMQLLPGLVLHDANSQFTPEAEAILRDGETKPTVSDVLTRLVASALVRHRPVNANFVDGKIHRFASANVGLAVAAPSGLVVPVIRDAERKSVLQIAADRADIVSRARDGKLQLADLEGGTFTISNLGMYGIEQFVAVLNPPQVAILAVGSIEDRAAAVDGELATVPTLTMTLTCDHRAIDGSEGAEFLRTVKQLVEAPALAL